MEDEQDLPLVPSNSTQDNQLPMASTQKGFSKNLLFVVGGLLLLILIGVGSYYLGTIQEVKTDTKSTTTTSPLPSSVEQGVICTMDAKICPDGSSVGRTGPNCEFAECPGSQDESVSKSSPSAVKIEVGSTSGWQPVTYQDVTFLIPPGFRFEEGDNLGLLYGPGSMVPSWIKVEEYTGSSRRQQFLGSNPDECKWMYEEALFGTVPALQIAADGGWCQGGYNGGIVSVVGDTLVAVMGLTYDASTEKIQRNLLTDTLVSTLKKAQ
jgi:hypothetical protein